MALAEDVGEALLEALFGDEVPPLIAYEIPASGRINRVWLEQKLGTHNFEVQWHGWRPFRRPYLIVRDAAIRRYSFNVSSIEYEPIYMAWAQSAHKTVDFERMHVACPEDLEEIARTYNLTIPQRLDTRFR